MPYFSRMPELTITAKGQVTIRKALLEGLGAKPGDRLRVEVRPDGGLVIPPVRRRTPSWADLAGSLVPPTGVSLTIDEINEAIAEAGAEAGMAGLAKP